MTIGDAVREPVAEPAWEIAKLFPDQGEWSEEDYLQLNTNHLVELTNGHVEVLPMPTPRHQRIVLLLYRLLWMFVTKHNLGEVLAAPLRVRLGLRKFREPDVVFIFADKLAQQGERYWENVDLVMEVVSPDDPKRDYEEKRVDYAQAGIAEYWLIDLARQLITVLQLQAQEYVVRGEFTSGMQATSALLTGFEVDVTEVFASAH